MPYIKLGTTKCSGRVQAGKCKELHIVQTTPPLKLQQLRVPPLANCEAKLHKAVCTTDE